MTQETLDKIVREYLIEAGYSTDHKYFRFLQIAISALREMNLDVSGVPKELHLDIDKTTNSVPLPDDFITHTKIGVCYNGYIHSIGFNNNICLPSNYDSCNTTNDENESEDISSGLISSTRIRNGEAIGGIYGQGVGYSIAYYKIDYSNSLILIKSTVQLDSVYLSYIADPSLIDGDYMVHPYDIEAIKSFIYWKDIQHNKNIGMREKIEAKNEWLRNKMNAKVRHKSFTLDEAKQVIRRSNKQAPKF